MREKGGRERVEKRDRGCVRERERERERERGGGVERERREGERKL